jgi:hypothetical protein
MRPAPCTISTLSRSAKSSGRGRFGVFPTRLHRHSRIWIRFRNQGDGETRGVSGESVFAISLTKHGGAVRAASSHRYWHLSGSRTRGMACRCVSLIAVLTPRTLAKKASGPMEGGMGYESPVVDWMQMPGADMTQPNSWNGIFTDILSNE